MQTVFWAGGILILSYLLGSIPFALLAGRLKGIDIRLRGSGNLGATNAIRVLGKPLGLTVFLLDFCKGFCPVLLVRILPGTWLDISHEGQWALAFSCGVAAVLGHIFPLYLRFKGGKGVAATAGMLLAVRWDAAIVSFAVFFLVRKLTGFVSLSSMALAVAFPITLILLDRAAAFGELRWVTAGTMLLALLIIYRHKGNVARIIKGDEPKVG